MVGLAFLYPLLALLATLTLEVAAEELVTFRPQQGQHYVAFYVGNVVAPEGQSDREAWHELDWRFANGHWELARAKNLITGYEHKGLFYPGTGVFTAGPGKFRADCHLKIKEGGTLKSQNFEWRADRPAYLYPCEYHNDVQVVCNNEASKCLSTQEQWLDPHDQDTSEGADDSDSDNEGARYGGNWSGVHMRRRGLRNE